MDHPRSLDSQKRAAFADVQNQEHRLHAIIRTIAEFAILNIPFTSESDLTFAKLAFKTIIRLAIAAAAPELGRIIYNSKRGRMLNLIDTDQDMVASLAQMACESLAPPAKEHDDGMAPQDELQEEVCGEEPGEDDSPDTDRSPTDASGGLLLHGHRGDSPDSGKPDDLRGRQGSSCKPIRFTR